MRDEMETDVKNTFEKLICFKKCSILKFAFNLFLKIVTKWPEIQKSRLN